LEPVRVRKGDPEIPAILALVLRTFAYMEGRIDPPSSANRLTAASIAEQCETSEVWAIGAPPHACVFLTDKPGRLYVGKLAVDGAMRGQGLARRLMDLAEDRARAKGLKELEIQVRIELVENHAAFARTGFAKTGETAHEGYDRPTSITMRKLVVD